MSLLTPSEARMIDQDAAKRWLPYAPGLVFILACLAYFISLWGGFVYDDVAAITRNDRVKEVQLWGQLWTKSYWELSADHLYRPLVSQTFALQWWLAPGAAWVFHLGNILLHGAVSVMVLRLGQKIGGARTGLLAAVLFAVHPVHAEAVAGIVGRAELMCTGAMLLGVLLMLDRPLRTHRAIWISLCMLAALLSKEQGLLMPFILLLAWFFQPSPRPREVSEKRALQITFIAVAYCFCAYIFLRELYLNLKLTFDPKQIAWQQNPLGYATGIHRALLPFSVLGHYVELLLFPHRMSIDYGGSVVGDTVRFSDPYFYIGCVSAVLLLGLLVLLWRRHNKPALFCLLAFGLAYGLISNSITLIGTVIAERLAYLPSVFVCLLLALFLQTLRGRVLVPVMGVLLLLGTYRTVLYAYQWNDENRAFAYSLKSQPMSSQLRVGVIQRMLARGEPASAAKLAEEGRRLIPKDYQIWLISVDVALAQDRPDEAQHYVKVARKVDFGPIIPVFQAKIDAYRQSHPATAPAR